MNLRAESSGHSTEELREVCLRSTQSLDETLEPLSPRRIGVVEADGLDASDELIDGGVDSLGRIGFILAARA